MQNYRFIVNGRVQGVFYRKTVYENSTKENFCGYVKNLPDGNVEACVSCEENDVDRFIDILKKGSKNSVVKTIEKYPCDEVFSSQFEIRYS
ncbi:acylphosphatase [Sulfurimonas sp.]